jgi:predicted nucleic acid-binding protein
MNVLVADASVILKWILPPGSEDYQQQAWAIIDAVGDRRVEIKVPSLWFFEVGNLLARRYPAQAEQQLGDLLAALGPGESLSAPDWQRQIVALTTRHRVTFYDAAYHALAVVNEGIFVTADEKYLKAVGDDKHAMHLKDWR